MTSAALETIEAVLCARWFNGNLIIIMAESRDFNRVSVAAFSASISLKARFGTCSGYLSLLVIMYAFTGFILAIVWILFGRDYLHSFIDQYKAIDEE